MVESTAKNQVVDPIYQRFQGILKDAKMVP